MMKELEVIIKEADQILSKSFNCGCIFKTYKGRNLWSDIRYKLVNSGTSEKYVFKKNMEKQKKKRILESICVQSFVAIGIYSLIPENSENSSEFLLIPEMVLTGIGMGNFMSLFYKLDNYDRIISSVDKY